MAIKYRRDESKVIARGKLFISSLPGSYYRLLLWTDRQAMRAASAEGFDPNEKIDGFCCHAPIFFRQENGIGPVQVRAPKLLGEIHFLRDTWDEEVVSHECFHATMHICDVLSIEPMRCIEMEEMAAYVHGSMVQDVYRWLWNACEPKPTKRRFLGQLRSLAGRLVLP